MTILEIILSILLTVACGIITWFFLVIHQLRIYLRKAIQYAEELRLEIDRTVSTLKKIGAAAAVVAAIFAVKHFTQGGENDSED